MKTFKADDTAGNCIDLAFAAHGARLALPNEPAVMQLDIASRTGQWETQSRIDQNERKRERAARVDALKEFFFHPCL